MNDPQLPPTSNTQALTTPASDDGPSTLVPIVSPNHRQGKVARLPKPVRDKINLMLLDGLAYARIISVLGEDGKMLNEDNIANWKSGGYQDWLAEQKVLEEMRIRRDYAIEFVRENEGATLHEATNKMATAQIRAVLRDLGAITLQKALEKNPDNYLRLLNTLARLTAGVITCEKHRLKDAKGQNGAEKEGVDVEAKVITSETLERIEEELGLM